MKRAFLSALLVLTLAACGGTENPDPAGTADTTEAPAPAPVAARMEDGVQIVEIAVEATGYSPASIQLQAGVPARLVFTRTVEGDCPSQVQAPALGIAPTALPLDEPFAVEFTPAEAGQYGFTCGMEMMEGTILVRS
jgi:plastocyanin domain-containing protein